MSDHQPDADSSSAASLKPVVVGIGGMQQDGAAIRYGAHAARHAGVPLVLVHAVPKFAVAALAPTTRPMTDAVLQAVGRELLSGARTLAATVVPECEISTRLVQGEVVPSLVEAAAGSRLLVLGDERLSAVDRLVVGSLIIPVAAQAVAPVVSVPSGWKEDPSQERRRILVGVKDYDNVSHELLRAALTLAREQRATVELAYVWAVPDAYGEVVASLLDFSAWQSNVDHRLRASLDRLGVEFADVEVVTSASFGRPAEVLRERSADADLVLLSRRTHSFPFGHFGTTARALLHSCACPVAVLPLLEAGAETTPRTATPPRQEPVPS